jgi:hypothetical protein
MTMPIKNPISVFFDNLATREVPEVDGRWLPIKGYSRYEINELTHDVRKVGFATRGKNGILYHYPPVYMKPDSAFVSVVFRLINDNGRREHVSEPRALMLGLAAAGMLP